MIRRGLVLLVPVLFVPVIFPVCAQQNLRGWHTQGQTFLAWEHSGPVPLDTSYEMYVDSQPISSISACRRIGRVFAGNGANKRIQGYAPDARWRLPDTLGETVGVDTNEAYFAVTPHVPGIAWYAVVLFGDTVVGPGGRCGPITETTDPVSCTVQHQDSVVTIYGHWIDGQGDHGAGRVGYPVMGGESSNGLGYNLAVWDRGSVPLNPPLVVGLHGGYSNLIESAVFGFRLTGVVFATLDDCLEADSVFASGTTYLNTYWAGYTSELDRFRFSYPSDSAVVVNYTARRVWWETEWLVENLGVDPERISLTGASMGGMGTLLHTQLRSHLFCCGLAYVPVLRGLRGICRPERVGWVFGDSLQNLATTFEGQPGIYDVLSQEWRTGQPHPDWPFTLIVSGRNDTLARWPEKPAAYRGLDSASSGFALYWDEREHTNWIGAHFRFSEHVTPSYLTRFSRDRSFPAFSGTDLDLATPGRQPDPGNGNPAEGDTWGTWGGYLEWDTETIVDSAGKWAATMWVVHESSCPNDIPAADTILAFVTPRRVQRFHPQPGRGYSWNLVRVSNRDTLQQDVIETDSTGVITVPGLLLIKEPTRLTIQGPVGIGESRPAAGPVRFWPSQPSVTGSRVLFKYQVMHACRVSLTIFNASGREVRVLQNGFREPGVSVVDWDGCDDSGRAVAGGVYFCRLEAPGVQDVRKTAIAR